MAYIELDQDRHNNGTILIFAEGTVLKPGSIFQLYNHKAYIPIGDCVEKIRKWYDQDAEIVYCTSRKKRHAEEMADLLRRFAFVGSRLYYRDRPEKYQDLIEAVRPDILIEDDCRSIGGSWQMCITHVKPDLKAQIKSIVVREFKGIDHLPENYQDL